MSTIEVAVAGRGIQVKQGYEKPSAGDVNTCEVSLEIESGGVWDSLPHKRVTFATRTASVTVDYAPTIIIPHEVMASPGALYLTLTGYDADGIEVARTHRMTYPIEVAKAGADEGAEPSPATLDVVSRIDRLASTLEAYETMRQEAFDSAQNERSAAFQSNMNEWSQDVAESVSQVSTAIETANEAATLANKAAVNANESADSANNAAAQVTAQYAEDKQAWDAEVSASAGEARAAGAEVKADYEQNVVTDYELRTAEWQSQLDEKATKDELAATIHEQEATDLMQDKRLENLEAAAKGVLYREDVDATEAYSKDVPAGAMPWASLDKVGGKTVVNDGELVSAEVVEVESMGKNLAIVGTFPIPEEVREMCPGYGWSAGTACNEIDFERKVYVQRVGSLIIGEQSKIGSNSGVWPSRSLYMIPNANNAAKHTGTNNNVSVAYQFTSIYLNIYGAFVFFTPVKYNNVREIKDELSDVIVYYELETPVEVDLSDVLSDDNFIEVEAGGTITFKQAETQLQVPSAVTYQVSTKEVVANA